MHQRNSSFYLSITFSLQSKYHFTGYSMYQRNFSSFFDYSFYSSSTIFSSYDIRYTILITLFYFLNVKEKSNSSSFSFKLFLLLTITYIFNFINTLQGTLYIHQRSSFSQLLSHFSLNTA